MDVERIKVRALPTKRGCDSDDGNLPRVRGSGNLKLDALGTFRGPRCAVKCAERPMAGVSKRNLVVLSITHDILQIDDYEKGRQ